MAILTASNLGKSYGAVDIFDGLSFNIPHRARIGLVGSNGVGKTTLMRVLVGEESPSTGVVQRAKGVSFGYLPQNARLESQHSLWDECLTVFSDLIQRQAALREMETTMGESQDPALIQTYGQLQDEFDRLGGYTYETKIRQTLTGLSFNANDLNRPLQQLSGGERTRALLARLLLESPDLLLLDEPTNHLDIAAVEWLESYLKDWPGAVLIVSHDRYFLDQVTDRIWEMTPQLETYRGNYSAYLQQREERYARQLAEYEAQQEFVQKEEEYIRRNIAGQNSRQAQGRRRRLERMMVEAKITPPPATRRQMRLQLDPGGRSGNLVLKTTDLEVGYADEGQPLFYAPDLLLERKECAAIIGPNGAGKTTFLKTILAQIPPLSGVVELGASLEIGYFAQAHEDLDPTKTLMDEIEAVSPGKRMGEIRDYLAKFLFSGEDVFKTVDLLSGGERGRLALAILALRGANLLLLDEPTNHLDLPSQEVLQSMLAEFNGTILLVSHDRFLIDALATQIWNVNSDTKKLEVYSGSYSEYKSYQQNQAEQRAASKQPTKNQGDNTKNSMSTPPGLSKNEKQQLEIKMKNLEAKINQLEEKLHLLGLKLQTPPEDARQVQQLGQDYQEVQDQLGEWMARWEEMALQLEG